MKIRIIPTLALALVLLSGCSAPGEQAIQEKQDSMKSALIVGSAESPDPVLEKIQMLERQGIVKDVVVLESFPVQIRLRAPQRIIEELNAMPRVGGLPTSP